MTVFQWSNQVQNQIMFLSNKVNIKEFNSCEINRILCVSGCFSILFKQSLRDDQAFKKSFFSCLTKTFYYLNPCRVQWTQTFWKNANQVWIKTLNDKINGGKKQQNENNNSFSGDQHVWH